MVTLAMGAAMIGGIYSLRNNRDQHGGRGFHLRLSTFQGSTSDKRSSRVIVRYRRATQLNRRGTMHEESST